MITGITLFDLWIQIDASLSYYLYCCHLHLCFVIVILVVAESKHLHLLMFYFIIYSSSLFSFARNRDHPSVIHVYMSDRYYVSLAMEANIDHGRNVCKAFRKLKQCFMTLSHQCSIELSLLWSILNTLNIPFSCLKTLKCSFSLIALLMLSKLEVDQNDYKQLKTEC